MFHPFILCAIARVRAGTELARSHSHETITLQCADPESATGEGLEQNRGDEQRPLILVVDDQDFMRKVARDWLEEAGFAVAEAPDGAQALEAFLRCRPSLVLLDVVMPVMDGFQACAELRKLPGGAHVPVLMMTGLDDAESIRRAYQVGATDFIHKPINGLVLGYRIRYMLRNGNMAEELRRSEAKLAKAQHTAGLGYWELFLPEERFAGSEELHRILGLPAGVPLTSWEDYLARVHEEDRLPIRDLMDQLLSDEQPRTVDFRAVWPDGTERIVRQQAEVTPTEPEGVTLVEGTLQDITDLRRAEERVRFLASYDALTGLPNRTLILDHLNLLLQGARGANREVALLLVGVDHFKRINDTLGHRAGDRLLRELGDRLVGTLAGEVGAFRVGEADCFVGRFGGDEFAAVLTGGFRVQEVARTAGRLTRAFRQPFVLEGQEVFLTASMGISLFPYDGRDAESLLRNAASAMAHAKGQGLTDYQFYTQAMNTTALDLFTLESNLRRAVERGEFALHYQPQVDLRSGEIVGVEALLRWQNPDRGLVYPLEFIHLSEDTGLILPIGQWVFETAFSQARKWADSGLSGLRMAVNVSAVQFRQKNFAGTIIQAFRDAGAEPRHLDIELTESTVMEDVAAAARSLSELKAMGLQVSVDDFGTGYSSLSYLRRFPLDALKIDYTFMMGLPEDEEHAALVSAIVALGKNLNLRVIAEGVESKGQLQFLREKGCDEAQGDFLCPALPASEVQRVILETWNPEEWRGELLSR